jgi:hypothetical protein
VLALARLVAAAFLAAADRFGEVERLGELERLAPDLFAALALAAFLVPARRVAAAFLAAEERFADFAFLVAAAFLAALDLDDLVDFLGVAMCSPFLPLQGMGQGLCPVRIHIFPINNPEERRCGLFVGTVVSY